VGRAALALGVAVDCGVDLILAGHLHMGYTGDVREHHVSLRRSILVAQAGTAISRRTRAEANAYNLVTVDPPELTFAVRSWGGGRFMTIREVGYRKVGEEWLLLP
jgi:3',5'-cyclic AMP phosphodiesterase CpdA